MIDLKIKIFLLKRNLFPERMKSEETKYILGKRGIKIGKGTAFYGNVTVDCSRPCLLEIGEYCKITSGTIILTHDYSRSVLRRVYGNIVGEARKTIIGNNVFIGMNSIILMGAEIGDNVIVGAGSTVCGKIPSNVVIGGNPAKIIRTLEEHYLIRKEKYVQEAKNFVKYFYEYNKRVPSIKELDPFYSLFLERDINIVRENQISMNLGGDDANDIRDKFLASKPVYDDYKHFINDCGYKL
jgi:acetyltransferase-like isoleucine patch superfamily enzyme